MRPLVETSFGKLRGKEDDGIMVFRGIPFAAPPVGDLRWRPPQPAETWSGEKDASEFGASAPQGRFPGGVGDLIGIPSERTSEDCLYLNVWTPGLEGRRPVMVWIHGGGNTVGSGTQPRINGKRLAGRGDVVMVTTNYRLGALGFLHAPELGASGNEALLDQTAALRWVRNEIANFGGDPANVTVFGQSAGGFDIAQLMGLPAAKGCFDKAVPMSGSLTVPVPKKNAERTTARVAERFGGMEKLRSVPYEEILKYQIELLERTDRRDRFAPVLDGKVILEDAAVPLGKGTQTRGMPLLIGNTLDEFALFTVPGGTLDDLDNERLSGMARRIFGENTTSAMDVYREARESRGQAVTPLDIWNAMVTDQIFRMPAIRTAELHSSHTPQTWMYLFDYISPAYDGRLGACHSIDIPFVWGTYMVEKMKVFCGEGPIVEELSERMMDIYLAFARTGNPRTDDIPEWPVYDTESRATMRMGKKFRVEEQPMDEERLFWEQYDI